MNVPLVATAINCVYSNTRYSFFTQRVANLWNSLPDSVNFRFLTTFKRTILPVDFNRFL